jgi:hypothetical protein
MNPAWSNPIPYDVTRTLGRASVPRQFAKSVPETPGTYVIYRVGQAKICDTLIDIGEAGLRPNSTPRGLRGRLATTVAHSASEKIAADINGGRLLNKLCVVWLERETKDGAKELHTRRADYLISPGVWSSASLQHKAGTALAARGVRIDLC